MTLGGLLQLAAAPLAKRVLAGLGFGIVTSAGVGVVVGSILDYARNAWTGMGGDVAAYLAVAGAHQALGIVAGAIAARAGLSAFKRLQLL